MMRLAAVAAAIVLTSTVLGGAYLLGYRSATASVQARWDRSERAHAEQAASLESEYRQRERAWAQANQELSDDLYRQRRAAQAQLDQLIADRDAGELRLRERFRGCGAGGVPSDATTAGDDDGAGAGGLSRPDEIFLVRLATEADDVAYRLAACQAYVTKAIR